MVPLVLLAWLISLFPEIVNSDFASALVGRDDKNPSEYFPRGRCAVTLKKTSHTTCEQFGRISPYNPRRLPHYYFAVNQTVGTFAECRDFCLRRTSHQHLFVERACLAFSFNTTSHACALYNQPLRGAHYDLEFEEDNTSDVLFSSPHCYPCAVRCPIKGQTNLLDNGGFELSKKYIGPWSGFTHKPYDLDQPRSYHHGRITSPGHTSSNAFFCDQHNCDISQYTLLCNFQVYQVKADVRVVDTMSKNKDEIKSILEMSMIKNFLYRTHMSDFSDGQWRTFQFDFGYVEYEGYYPNELLFRLESGLANNTVRYNFYLDNVVLQKAPSTYSTTGQNLLTNGGFETGDLTPWIYKPLYPHKLEPHEKYGVVNRGLTNDSQYSFAYNTLEGRIGHYYHYPIYGAGFSLSQMVTLVPFQPYLLSLHIRGNATSFAASIAGYEFNPMSQVVTTKTMLFQRVFTPTIELAKLTLSSANNSYYDYFDYVDPTEKVFLDNISILPIDNDV